MKQETKTLMNSGGSTRLARSNRMTRMLNNLSRIIGFVILIAGLSGCSTFQPQPQATDSFLERKSVKTSGDVTVSAVVPSVKENAVIFGVKITKKRIQPIWIEVDNRSDEELLLLPILIDQDYYAPMEVAYKFRNKWSKAKSQEKADFFVSMHMPHYIPPNTVASGYVYGRKESGIRYAQIMLLRDEHEPLQYSFALQIPGVQADYERVDFENLYTEDEMIHINDPDALREALQKMPRCTVDKKGKNEGDPLNLVMIGVAEAAGPAFAQRNWGITEEIRWGTLWKTTKAFFTGSKYQSSPVSSLYVFGRRQDTALQKIRGSIHERNHLRMWLTPIVYKEMNVWIGQISRDIGVRFTSKTIITHKIDPDVDSARLYLAQDLLLTQHVQTIGYVEGVDKAPQETPRKNLTGDPYFTDGLRLVTIISPELVHDDDLQMIEWADIPAAK
jgi:hypothetical protein